MNRVLRRSVEYAFAHRTASLEYVREHAQEMSEDVMYKHIDLYVNDTRSTLAPKAGARWNCCSRSGRDRNHSI